MQDKYEKAESFIRYGPVQRIIREEPRRVGFFPWRFHNNGALVKTSIQNHYRPLTSFINENIRRSSKTLKLATHPDFAVFAVTYWCIFLSIAIPITRIVEMVHAAGYKHKESEIRNKIYCMEIAGWVSRFHYSNVEYFCTTQDNDPFRYKFNHSVTERDSARRTFSVADSLRKRLKLNSHVRRRALDLRSGS